MAIASFSDLKAAMAHASRLMIEPNWTANSGNGSNVKFGVPTANPYGVPAGAGQTYSKASSGAWPFNDPPSGGSSWMLANLHQLISRNSIIQDGFWMLTDRLWACGGFSAISTSLNTITPQTFLPRGTGEGVICCAEVTTTIGATPQNVTVSYTNQAGTSGRTGTIAFDASAGASTWAPMQFQAGDYGVNSIESFQLGGSTGTAGAYGLVLARPLFHFPGTSSNRDRVFEALQTCLVKIDKNAALTWVNQINGNSSAPHGYGMLVE